MEKLVHGYLIPLCKTAYLGICLKLDILRLYGHDFIHIGFLKGHQCCHDLGDTGRIGFLIKRF